MDQPSQLLRAPADGEEFTAWAQRQGWADGLPLVPPTPERVAAMVRASGRAPEEEIGVIPPRNGLATVEVLAANAVLAGCRPEHLPVLVAAVAALLDPDLNLQGLQCTTNPAGPLVVVNGPVRHRLGIACAGNALAGGHPANLTIGRALQLVLRNVGGAVPPIDQSVLGSPVKRGLVLGENEEESPWPPLHRRRGLPEDSAVTVLQVESMVNVPAPYRDAGAILQMMALAMCNGLNLHYSSGVLMACFNPVHARILADAGYCADRVRAELFQRARVPVSAYPPEGNASQAEWVREGDQVLMTDDVSKVEVMVAGAGWPAHSMCFNGWAISAVASRPVTGGGNHDGLPRRDET
jgi:hypothetical protein